MNLHWQDFLFLNEQIPAAEQALVEKLSAALDQILPTERLEKLFMASEFPRDIIPVLGELGVLGVDLEGYGCAGRSPLAYGLVMRELEKRDSGLRSFVSVQVGLGMYAIWKFGSEEQKKSLLPVLARGKQIISFALTEPNWGSNPGRMETRLEGKPAQGFTLTGQKKWVTNASMAQRILVWAKDDQDKIRGALVDTQSPGVTVRKITNKHSLKISESCEVSFSKVPIAEEDLLEVQGMKGPLSCLTHARMGIAWGALGIMQSCLEEALGYLQREQFDRPLSGHQLIQAKLVEIFESLQFGHLLCLRLAELAAQDRLSPQQVSLAKKHNVSKALHATRLCRDMLGANGILNDYTCMRHMLNLETVNTYEGTEDVHRLILGQFLTGQNAFN